MRLFHMAVAAMALSGCVSSHNLATDGRNPLGGGYLELKIDEGVYRIFVKTNWSPWVNTSAARSSWQSRARGLCGSDKFRELEIRESSFDQMPPGAAALRYIVTTRFGYVVCDSANLSDEAALALIYKR
jgi:hypothetical protein